MAKGLYITWRRIRSLLGASAAVNTSDDQLLARFVADRDDDAFAELVSRHGPMVQGVCRRILANAHDTDDAFQATFLILSRKAASIRNGASLACWLHNVARHVAVRLKRNLQQRKDQTPLPDDVPQAERDDVSWREVRQLLDDELARLPQQLRLPLILCYLEGKTRDEAAEELGWSLSTFRGRLERGRERLRRRLERRGLALSAALLATLTVKSVHAALPLTTTASPQAAALATEVTRTMFLGKLKTLLLWCVVLLLLGGGGGVAAYRYGGGDKPAAPPVSEVPPVAKPAKPPEDDGLVQDYKAHLDLFDFFFALKPQDKERYPLRNVQLYVGDMRFEPSGRSYEAHAQITKEQAAKIIDVLARDNFFRESVGDAERLTPHKGSHVEIWASYRKNAEAQPNQRWRTLEWDLHMVKQLEAIRACVDGDAAKLLDQLLKSLEDERKEWEKNQLFVARKVEDLDRIWSDPEKGSAKEKVVTLDGVLPFAAWPKDLTAAQKKMRDDGLELAKKWLEGQTMYYHPTSPSARGDLVRFTFGPTKVDAKWTGQLPAEQTAWGGFDVNILLIQEGYSPWVQRPVDVWDAKTKGAYSEAQEYARINTKGIWKDRDLADRLLAIAQVRTGLERVWGLGPIKEWRKIASNVGQIADLLDRGGMVSLFLSPDGKTVLIGGDYGTVKLLDAFTMKAKRDLYDDKRQYQALGFTDDNQPWLLWVDAEGALPNRKQVGTTYHLVNATTDKERCTLETAKPIHRATLSHDGNYLAIIEDGDTSRVALWDAHTGKKLADLGDHKNGIKRLAFSPDDKTLATGSDYLAKADPSVREPGEIKLWDVEKRKEKASCKIPATCTGLQFTADGKRLFASTNRPLEKAMPAGNEGWIVWFDTVKLEEQGRQKGLGQQEKVWVQAFAATPDGKMLAVLWWEYKEYNRQRFPMRHLRVYEVESGKEIASPEPGLSAEFLRFSSDGNYLLAGGDQLAVGLWEALRR